LKSLKQSLVLLVGSGASMPCGVPGTASLTKTAFTQLPSQEMRRIFIEALRGAYGTISFELLLYALENLSPFIESAGVESPTRRPILSLFADLLTRYRLLYDRETLEMALVDIVRAIHKEVGDASKLYQGHRCQAQLTAQDRFLRACAERFRLIVINLNYDTLYDQAPIDWQDGFAQGGATGRSFQAFNSGKWLDSFDSSDHLLIHLHGSARFAYASADVISQLSQFHEQVCYESPELAAAAFPRLPNFARNALDKAGLPIISGLGKVLKLSHNMRPYGHYQFTAMRALFQIPRLLVIGYGGLDDHVNIWLEEHAAIHGVRRRAAAILTRRGEEVDKPSAKRSLLEMLAGGDGWNALRNFAFDGPEKALWFGGYLALAPSGAPEAYEYADEILTFLGEAGQPLIDAVVDSAHALRKAIPKRPAMTP